MENRLPAAMKVGWLALALTLTPVGADAQEPDPLHRFMASEIVVRETHVGLSGFVLDSTGRAVMDAEIRAFPDANTRSDEALMRRSHHYTRSVENGGFFIPLVPGNYAVRISRPGFGVTTVNVMVPPVGGRCVAVWLEAPHARQRMRDPTCARL
ncbi:MAG: carboxypeptidase-like regulatory domain-containing protein [Gemmatimonadaceae bacterium]